MTKVQRRINRPKQQRNERRSFYDKQQILLLRQKFVERIEENQRNFEKFCADFNENRFEPRKAKNLSSIFTVSPFSAESFHVREALKTRPHDELPLKFPWNGVFQGNRVETVRQRAEAFFHCQSK